MPSSRTRRRREHAVAKNNAVAGSHAVAENDAVEKAMFSWKSGASAPR